MTYQQALAGVIIGWNKFSNPLIHLSESFKERSEGFKDLGGSLDFNNYFSGEKAAFFANFQYRIRNNMTLSFEYDPTFKKRGFFQDPNYVGYKYQENKINSEISFFKNNFIGKIAVIGGDELHFQITYKDNFSNINTAKEYKNNITRTNNRYYNLQKILDLNNIGLIGVDENISDIHVKVRHNSYSNLSTPSKHIHQALQDALENANDKDIYITHTVMGMDVAKNKIPSKDNYSYKNLPTHERESYSASYIVKEKFPYFTSDFNLVPRFFIAEEKHSFILH